MIIYVVPPIAVCVNFKREILQKLDEYRSEKKQDRSVVIEEAIVEYLKIKMGFRYLK